MAKKDLLRELHENTILNKKSKHEDKQCVQVISSLLPEIEQEFGVRLVWEKNLNLTDVINTLKTLYPSVSFADPTRETSHMSPDGGVVYLTDKNGKKYPILITEVKNQGTNDARATEGKPKQALGNAIERLGKNVIGLRAYMLGEAIFPFVCFGDGCDFAEGSFLLDRVLTISMFGSLNADHTSNEGPNGIFDRGSFYFRAPAWTADEMKTVLRDVARKSVYYYFSKYGDDCFKA